MSQYVNTQRRSRGLAGIAEDFSNGLVALMAPAPRPTTNVGLIGTVSGGTLYNGPSSGALPIGTVSGAATVKAETTDMFQVSIPGWPTGWIGRGQVANLHPAPVAVKPAAPATSTSITSSLPAAPASSYVPAPKTASAGIGGGSTLPLLAVAGLVIYFVTKKGR